MSSAKVDPEKRRKKKCVHAGDSLRGELEYYSLLSSSQVGVARGACVLCVCCAMRFVAFVVPLGVFSRSGNAPLFSP